MGTWRTNHVDEPLVKLSVSITHDLRRLLDEAREDSEDNRASIFRKHTLSSEVEELLRIGLKAKASGNFLTLQLDDGIWAWLMAYVKGVGLYGSAEDTAIAAVRKFIIKDYENKYMREAMLPHLPPRIQKACGYGP